MKNRKNTIISLLLCACMLVCVLSSCAEKEEEIATVLRFTEDIEAGKKILPTKVQELNVPTSELPEGTLAITAEEFAGTVYYAATEIFSGDYLTKDRISTEKPEDESKDDYDEINQSTDDYVIVEVTSKDCHAELQKLIDENPNRTIYFPDGVYNISKSLNIPTSPDKRVSLRFSQYAVLAVQDANAWEKGTALIHYGKGETVEESFDYDTKATVSGGTIHGKKVATGIFVEGAGNLLINHIALKEVTTAIHIKADHVNVDSFTGIGSATEDSIGVLVDGSHNTISNMRIYRVFCGVKLLQGENVLRNLHPLYALGNEGNARESVGFWDLSEGNFYDYCYSDQFATAFRLCDGNMSLLDGCFAFWYSKDSGNQWGIHAQGKFNSAVYNTCISMEHTETNNAYLVVDADGGTGKVVYPVGIVSYSLADDHASDLKKYIYNN